LVSCQESVAHPAPSERKLESSGDHAASAMLAPNY
jgi:hypothetical protein